MTTTLGRATAQTEPVGYFDVADVERMIANPCREGCLPVEKTGGFKVEVSSVVTADAVEEIREAYCQNEM